MRRPCAGHEMRPRKSTPPGERWNQDREASAWDNDARAETLGPVAKIVDASDGRQMSLRLRNTLTRRVETVEPLEPGRVADVHLRPDRLPLRPRRQPAQQPAGRPHPADAALPRHRRLPRQEHHRRRPPARRGLRPRCGPDARRRRPRAQDAGRDRRRVRGRLPRRRGRWSTSCPPTSSRAPPSTSRRCSPSPRGSRTPATPTRRRRATSTTTSAGSRATAACPATRLADLRAGHRGDIEPDKRDPADFALWKSAGDGRILKWPTARWGEGFPGWHLECSAMAMRYLGPRFDIHTGGIDNVFPHHEDEIAQSTPISGAVPARHWVHGEFLLMEGKKMAKSAGNFQRVTELVDRGLDPLAFRYLVLTSRYSRKLEYSDRSLDAAAAALGSLRAGLRALGEPPTDGPWAAPAALVAGAAGDRPAGIATGLAGHGTAPDGPSVHDHGPCHGAGRSPVRRRSRAARAFRGGHRRRPGHARRAGPPPRDPARAAAGRRAALAHPRRGRGPRPRPPPGLGGGRGRGPRTTPSRTGSRRSQTRGPPPAPSATGRAPMRSGTSSRRLAGSSSTVPRAADSNDAGLRRPASIRRCDGHRSRPS